MGASGLVQRHVQRREAPIGNGAVAAYNGVRAMDEREEARKQRSRDFWMSQPPSDLSPFLPATMKDDVAATQAVFTVYSLRHRNTQYGGAWFADIELHGQRWCIPFSALEFRQEQMEGLQAALREGPIDATLRSFEADQGHGWALAEPPGYNADGVLPERPAPDAETTFGPGAQMVHADRVHPEDRYTGRTEDGSPF